MEAIVSAHEENVIPIKTNINNLILVFDIQLDKMIILPTLFRIFGYLRWLMIALLFIAYTKKAGLHCCCSAT